MTKRSDVARAAGVAESTVSYALSGSRPISEETKKRIHKAMKDLDYKPNAVAAALRSGNSKMIGLVFGVNDHGINQSDISYVLGAADTARELGYHLVLWPIRDREIQSVVTHAQSGLLDGVILMEIKLDDSRVKLFNKLGIPVALIGRTAKPERDIYADRDFEGAIRIAFEELVQLGHKSIDFLSTAPKQVAEGFGAVVRAEEASLALAKEFGVKLNILHADVSLQAGIDLATKYFQKAKRATAIISTNTDAVTGFARGALKAGVRIPEDFSIICIATPAAEAITQEPSLTTVSPPASEIAGAATRALIKSLARLEFPDPEKLWSGTLIRRESTGPAKK